MILLGSFVGNAFSKWYVVFATTGVILAAVYMLWMFQRVMFGKLDKTNESLPDLNAREIVRATDRYFYLSSGSEYARIRFWNR